MRSAETSGAEKILAAALELFAERGVDATSVRAVAERAGVSPALVIHHHGSKQSLRAACDELVVVTIRERKTTAMSDPGLDPVAALREWDGGSVLLRYLARTLADGTPAVAGLVDRLVADAVAYSAAGVASGLLRPTEHPHERAAVLTLWSLGALVLREHGQRLLGVDLAGDPRGFGPYATAAAELLTGGLISEGLADRMRQGHDEQER